MTPGDSAVIELIDSHLLKAEELAERARPTPQGYDNSSTAISRRRTPRIDVHRTVVAIPVLPDGRLDPNTRYQGMVVDAADGGLGLQLNIPRSAAHGNMVIGVALPDKSILYQGVELRHVQPVEESSCRVGASYAGPAQQILGAPVLAPQFDPQVMQYRFPVPEEVLAGWIEAGILRPRLLDRVQVCPRCDTLATFRLGCRSCKSGRVERERLIHHFCCAHVDRIAAFDYGNQLRCPKCQKWPLIVGADFDYQDGVTKCLDCGWTDSEPVSIGHCFRCGLRFPGEQAKQHDLIGYDVQRLDPLALLPAS